MDDDRLGGAGDALYARLVKAHRGLDAAASAALNARLVLILMNAVGDADTIVAAIERAEASGRQVSGEGADDLIEHL